MPERLYIKREFKKLFKNMDFIVDNFLNKGKINAKTLQRYFDIYQQLGLAWQYLAERCRHWDGFKRNRERKSACKICGTVAGGAEAMIHLPVQGVKVIGKMLKPNSKKAMETKDAARLLDDSIKFHGVSLNVSVHNAYKSKLFKEMEISIAAERRVVLREEEVMCRIDPFFISVTPQVKKQKKGSKPPYGAFLSELKKSELKKFPVLARYDDAGNLLELQIFRKR